MRWHHRHRHNGTEIALANFALTFAKALLVLCVVMFVLINPIQTKDGSKPKAEYLISVEWSSTGRYDVDTWTQIPDGRKVSYQAKEKGIVFLERDDLGNDCDSTTINGKKADLCEEITVIRGVITGDYAISLHLFSANSLTTPADVKPITVHIKIEKLNPSTTIVWQGTRILDRIRQEKPVLRFTVADEGAFTNIITDDLEPMIYGSNK
jgi:hypothetical protein